MCGGDKQLLPPLELPTWRGRLSGEKRRKDSKVATETTLIVKSFFFTVALGRRWERRGGGSSLSGFEHSKKEEKWQYLEMNDLCTGRPKEDRSSAVDLPLLQNAASSAAILAIQGSAPDICVQLSQVCCPERKGRQESWLELFVRQSF